MSGDPSAERDDSLDLPIVQNCLRELHSKEAWDAFVTHFGPFLRRCIASKLRTGSEEDRDDLFQALILKVMSRDVLSAYKPDKAAFRAFLYTVAVNEIRNYHRKGEREQLVADASELADELATAADMYPKRSEASLIDAILDHLDSMEDLTEKRARVYKALLELKSAEEVARSCEVSEATVYRYRKDLLTIAHSVLDIPDAKKLT